MTLNRSWGKHHLLIYGLVNQLSILCAHVNHTINVSSSPHDNNITSPSSCNSSIEGKTAVVLTEYNICMFLPIVANHDGSVMNEVLNLAMFENSLHPRVSTRRIGHSFAALGSHLRLYNLPDWTVILTIKSCPNEA
jgi:hypothetical protein